MPKKRTNPTKRTENRSSGALTDESLAAAATANVTSLLVPPAASPRRKPAITPVAPNTNLLARLNAFLPAMAQANDALLAAIARDGRDKYDIETIDKRDGPVIQMKLGLGLFEGKPPTGAAASGSAGNADVTTALDRLRLPGTGALSSSARRTGITDLTTAASSDSGDSDSDSDASMADGDDEDARTRPKLVPVGDDAAMDVDSDVDDDERSDDDDDESGAAAPVSLEAMVTDFFNQDLDDSDSEDESAGEGDESRAEKMAEWRL
ncbi:hypothetical protein AMAG_14685 [Allomyces macrogynus ATCC 38327]|uniref:Uncharacterized protein n=1 Tax=Allomyces macrogynus (strain ATCC 38327) TaxID=578462 RepID=A0A0L0T6Y8_ALLM3|nr:hypothetical protein AMAG_14685 [Allomyces macrogynus ATCC 38327]|eukprot:KNE70563.1 hypothetical protein AMAG_14685 [Allomyces macrogynus ATCC 38327]